MISVSCYPEALIDAFLCLQVIEFVVSCSKTFLYSKGILRMRAVTFSATNLITRGRRFSNTQEIVTEETYSTPLWGLAVHVRALPTREVFKIYGVQDF